MPLPHDELIADLQVLSSTRQSDVAPLAKISNAIALVDERGLIAFVNNAVERLFGYAHGELAQQPFERLFPEAKAGFDLNARLDAWNSGDPQVEHNWELRGRKKDGSPIFLTIAWSATRLADHRFAVANIADVTEDKLLEGALRQYEEQRALIFSEGLLGDFSWNMERDELEAHPTVFKLYGAAPIPGPVPGDWFRSRQHPDDRLDVEKKWRSQIAEGGTLAVEFRVNGDDGVTRWIDCRGIVICDAQGMPSRVHGLNIDITARKQAELERRECEARASNAEERLSAAVQFSNTAVWRWYRDEDLTEWFGPVLELTGRCPAELASFAAFKAIVFPLDQPLLEENVARCYTDGSDFRHEFRIVRPDGEIRWLAGRGGVMRDPKGRIYGMTGVNFDITVRKAMDEKLTQSERNFRQLTNLVPQIVFTSNASGFIDYLNERFYDVSGFSPASQPSPRWVELLSEEDRESTIQAWLVCVTGGQIYQRECRFWDRRFAEHRWHLVRAIPVRNEEGTIVRWIGTATDVHDQKTAAEHLEYIVESRTLDLKQSLSLVRKREGQLEKSLQEKDALLREIHHRVKNNLQIVSSLLNMQAATAADSAAAAPLLDSQRRISSMAMIHEQLYATEDMQTVEFAQHARSLSEGLRFSMAGSPLVTCRLDLQTVNLSIHQAIPCALILNELLTNAFKYAYPPESGGEITVCLLSESGFATLTVSDKGVGLPADVNPFLPKTLGMEIVKVLVHQLEGELIVGDPPGASFSVRFRLQKHAGEASSADTSYFPQC